jgi:hypothetical protein
MRTPPFGTCARCGATYSVGLAPYAAQGSGLCDICELTELLTERPAPEEDEVARVRTALGLAPDGVAAGSDPLLWGQPSAPVRALLGVPADVYPTVMFYWGDGFVDPKDARRWATFRAELLHCAPEALGRPHPWVEPIPPQPQLQALLRWRVWRVDAPGVLQLWFDSSAQRERRRADDVDSSGLSTLEAFLGAVRDARLRGRPVGSAVMSCTQFRAELAAAYSAWETCHGHRPTMLDIAYEMRIPYETVRTYCRRCQVTWHTYRPE